VLPGILPPEVVALRIGFLRVGQRNAHDLSHKLPILESHAAQLSPIRLPAAADPIVQGRQGVSPMIQMPVQYGRSFFEYARLRVPNRT